MQEESALRLAMFIFTSLGFAILIAVCEPFELILTGAVLFGLLFLGILMLLMLIFEIKTRWETRKKKQ